MLAPALHRELMTVNPPQPEPGPNPLLPRVHKALQADAAVALALVCDPPLAHPLPFTYTNNSLATSTQ